MIYDNLLVFYMLSLLKQKPILETSKYRDKNFYNFQQFKMFHIFPKKNNKSKVFTKAHLKAY